MEETTHISMTQMATVRRREVKPFINYPKPHLKWYPQKKTHNITNTYRGTHLQVHCIGLSVGLNSQITNPEGAWDTEGK